MAAMQVRVRQPLYGGTFATDCELALPFVLSGELLVLSDVPADNEGTTNGTVAPPPTVLESSPERVAPRCVHFGACGGCHYQHASSSYQLAIKAEILQQLLGNFVGSPLPPIQTHSSEAYEYRNRIRMRVERSEDGLLALGYNLRSSNTFFAVRMCPIASPTLWAAAEALIRLTRDDSAGRRWLSSIAEIEFSQATPSTGLQITFFLREGSAEHPSARALAEVCESIRRAVPALSGACVIPHPSSNRQSRRNWDGVAWGTGGSAYEAAGRTYWVSRGAFFQVNRFLVDRLVALVCEGRAGSLAWDLFAGVGLFTRALTSTFAHVVAVEGADVAAGDLARASKGGKGRVSFEAVHMPALEFLRTRQHQRERPNLVVLDPPRAGLGREGAGLLAEAGAEEIVYVSCDPGTLARDLAVLTQKAYEVEAVHLIDLFPQTFHIETIVHLRRRALSSVV